MLRFVKSNSQYFRGKVWYKLMQCSLCVCGLFFIQFDPILWRWYMFQLMKWNASEIYRFCTVFPQTPQWKLIRWNEQKCIRSIHLPEYCTLFNSKIQVQATCDWIKTSTNIGIISMKKQRLGQTTSMADSIWCHPK